MLSQIIFLLYGARTQRSKGNARADVSMRIYVLFFTLSYRLSDDDFIFRRHDSQLPMTPTTFTWRFKLILKKNNLPEKLNVHSLRHTNASLMIANGADVATVAGLLGHSQVSTTLDIYTHAFDKNKREASRQLQENLDL